MISNILIAGAVVLGWVSSASAAPLLGITNLAKGGVLVHAPVTVQLPLLTLPARVIVGDAVCAVSEHHDITARVFAAVNLHAVADISLKESLHVPILLAQELVTKASLETQINTCLCVTAGISTNLLHISDAVRIQAEADIVGYVKSNTDVSASVAALGFLLAKADTSVKVAVRALAHTECPACAAGWLPTCAHGACGCIRA